jgi:hypothetical protein
MQIEWVPGYTEVSGNERACLAGEAASQGKRGRTSIAWFKERISQHYTTAKEMETQQGKEAILPPAPKKSFLDRTPNRLSRKIAHIRTGHWFCGSYLKRVQKNHDEPVSGRCWWCGQWRVSRAHVFLRCMHPTLEHARKEIWERLDENGRGRPKSVGQLLGKSKWEKPLCNWIMATGLGLLGPGLRDLEAERLEKNDG